jgi:hypothetical protein
MNGQVEHLEDIEEMSLTSPQIEVKLIAEAASEVTKEDKKFESPAQNLESGGEDRRKKLSLPVTNDERNASRERKSVNDNSDIGDTMKDVVNCWSKYDLSP